MLRGPSQFDCLFLDENLAIESMHGAVERWGEQGEIAIVYPDPTIANRHPYYILNVPWSDERHYKAAAEFLEFLVSTAIQRHALAHGLRPSRPLVPLECPRQCPGPKRCRIRRFASPFPPSALAIGRHGSGSFGATFPPRERKGP